MRIAIQNWSFCPVCNVALERQDLVRGYEFAKGQYVRFTDAELESIEAETNSSIELKEFIPTRAVDPVYFERSYLAPDKGGEKPYRLLAAAMEKAARGALGGDGKPQQRENFVLIRAARGGLMLLMMY
jgi:DNA end-binding protein Ku